MPPQEEETTFTLSFGGVEFCLAPSTADDVSVNNDVMSISKIGNGEVLINLNNFVGTLRVKNHQTIAEASSSALPATESLIGNENNEDDNMSIEVLSQNETSGAVVAAAVPNPVEETPPPNPVEDTPSPEAKSFEEVEPAEKPKQRKGQQKLNFFGKRGKKQSEKSETPKRSTRSASKRSPAKEDAEPANRKKSRKSNKKSEEKESADTEDFNDIIEQPKNESENNENLFTFASLGQSMPSQENESTMDDCDLSLDPRREATDDVKPMSNPKEGTISVVSKRPAQGTSVPCPRWGQTMTMIDHKRFIVYGGQTIEKDTAKPLADLFVYDLMEHTWTKPVNCDGIARTWHTANFLPDRQLLLCFGGEVLSEKTGKLTTTDQVMVLDCEIMLWYPPTVSGQVPSGRSGHASCVLPQTNSLVVFGGVKNGKWLNSVSILDTNRWKWTSLKAAGDAPPPRSYHSATAISSDGSSEVGNRVVIFGGNNGSKSFNGVHVLEATGEGKKWIWSNPKCKGNAPSPRTGHNATLLNDGSTILVYGGWDPNTEDENGDDLIFGDSFLLNTKTWTWRKGPKPRYEKSTNKTANGGAGRVGHSAVLAPGSDGVQVLAFGGRVSENKFVGDFQSLVVPL
eukprot:CAMPEP_0201933644 /NCGR_PEP_ID=MMETSP0903-20130614/32005_1 /ASSEMBLY_ACC=CAM_ASM_000552 /TAXON_ID=420261 /ORGANISM="Thalassiosira antarctica, Strain CCMP982" /LENGTH=625 /DNA_ID=CAMNT_0048473641 /DNA_START=30 /DNA_END=1907 /DNA_ORIENTATION=+